MNSPLNAAVFYVSKKENEEHM